MFINESKILKKICLGDKASIVIYLVYYLNILPQLMYNSTKFKEGGYRKQLTIAWLFWDVTFYYEVKQNNPTTATTEATIDGSLVNNYLKETVNTTTTEPDKAPEEEVNKEIAKERFDDLEFTKIKLKMIQAKDLFKKKWDEIEDSIKKNNYYTVTPDDLADANIIINKPKSIGKESEYLDYFRKHFNQITITSEDVSIWGKLEKEWLEGDNFITPIPMDGSKITASNLIHTLMFAPPSDIFDYLRSRMFGQKDKQSWELSDDNVDAAITSALNQVGISEEHTKRFDIVKKSWENFHEKYGGKINSLCEFSSMGSADKIKKFFIDNYSDNWNKVRESITKNYYFNCFDFSNGGRADIEVVSNTSVFKKILKDIFDIDPDLPENEYVKEYIQKYTYNIKFTLNDLDRPALDSWSQELYNLVEYAESDPRGSCECILTNRLVKYAYAPSKNWHIYDFYSDIEKARKEFDKELLDTLYSNKWKEVYDSIQTTGKYEVTVEDLKQYTKDYYTYISNKVKELSNTYIFTPLLKEILNRIDTAFAIRNTYEYKKFEITQEKYTSWKEDNFFTRCGGIVPVYPIEWTEWKHRDDMFSYAYLLNKDKTIKEDILAHSYIFVPPACMTDFYEKNENQGSIEEQAMEAVRIIQEAADEAIKSIGV